MEKERLQKILARAGYGSRRSVEKLIADGRVKVNGKKAILGTKADPSQDEIRLDHEVIVSKVKMVYIAVNKARGIISTTGGPDKRRIITDVVPNSKNLHIVGRLDADSEGLMLLTNDGALTNQLTHPRYGHEKEYIALVSRNPSTKEIEAWQRGIVMKDGHKSRPAKVSVMRPKGKGAWLNIVMKEGRKRQIREIAELLGIYVVKLKRVRISSLSLGRLKTGDWKHLSDAEVLALKSKRKIA